MGHLQQVTATACLTHKLTGLFMRRAVGGHNVPSLCSCAISK